MKRVAFTIVYNGLHHLKHDAFAERMSLMFDHWFIVEGAARNTGSTAWCKTHPGADNSTDGTIEYLIEFCKTHPNTELFIGLGKWENKDVMCNHALKMIDAVVQEQHILVEVDTDEQWTQDALDKNIDALILSASNVGGVRWNHFVSHDLIAVGDWGGNLNTRFWIRNHRQKFTSHEPPVLNGQRAVFELPEKCNHYSYLFDSDVHFKSKWYGGHERIYDNWLKLQLTGERKQLSFPLHISYLFGNTSWIGRSNSHIIEFPHATVNR